MLRGSACQSESAVARKDEPEEVEPAIPFRAELERARVCEECVYLRLYYLSSSYS